MAVSKEQVLAFLESDEPDYAGATKLGPGALSILEDLLDDASPGIAAKAASLAGMIGGEKAVTVLKKAGASSDPIVRVAAAGAASSLAPLEAAEVLAPLVTDRDIGVQKTAMMATPSTIPASLKRAIEEIDPTTIDPAILDLRDRALRTHAEIHNEGAMPGVLNQEMGQAEDEASTTEMPVGNMPTVHDTASDAGETMMPDGDMG
jgi:hypothetical protein